MKRRWRINMVSTWTVYRTGDAETTCNISSRYFCPCVCDLSAVSNVTISVFFSVQSMTRGVDYMSVHNSLFCVQPILSNTYILSSQNHKLFNTVSLRLPLPLFPSNIPINLRYSSFPLLISWQKNAHCFLLTWGVWIRLSQDIPNTCLIRPRYSHHSSVKQHLCILKLIYNLYIGYNSAAAIWQHIALRGFSQC